MNEIINSFLNKECLIYTMNNQTITGKITNVNEGWITVEAFQTHETQAVNAEYITRIREYPKDKHGKKRSVVLD